MRVRSCRALAASVALALLLGLSLDLALVSPGPVHAVEAPLELKWNQLVPPAPPAPPKSFLAGRPPGLANPGNPDNPHDGAPAAPLPPEGRWMSGPIKSG